MAENRPKEPEILPKRVFFLLIWLGYFKPSYRVHSAFARGWGRYPFQFITEVWKELISRSRLDILWIDRAHLDINWISRSHLNIHWISRSHLDIHWISRSQSCHRWVVAWSHLPSCNWHFCVRLWVISQIHHPETRNAHLHQANVLIKKITQLGYPNYPKTGPNCFIF